jgi:hypothetical protein
MVSVDLQRGRVLPPLPEKAVNKLAAAEDHQLFDSGSVVAK